MSNPVNETSQKEHQRSAGNNQEVGPEVGLAMAPPPFQLATNPSANPIDNSGNGGDAGDGMPVQRKVFPNTPPATPENPDNGSNSNPFQLKAGADASTVSGNSVHQPFQLKKSDESKPENKESFALQRKASNGGAGGGGGVDGGQNVMTKMESALGADFSNVKIHQNSDQATKVGALAYTQGNDVHFAPGQFNPSSQGGQELLGHELTHVVQQREGKVKPTTEIAGKAVNDDKHLEAEADKKGAEAAQFKMDNNAGANLKSGGNGGGKVAQAKLADEPTAKLEKDAGESLDKNQDVAKKDEKKDADKSAEKTSKVKTPEEKVAKQDQESQSEIQKDREQAKDSGTYDAADTKSPEDKAKEKNPNGPISPDKQGLQESDEQGENELDGLTSEEKTSTNDTPNDGTGNEENPDAKVEGEEVATEEKAEGEEDALVTEDAKKEGETQEGEEEKKEGEENAPEGEGKEGPEGKAEGKEGAEGGGEGSDSAGGEGGAVVAGGGKGGGGKEKGAAGGGQGGGNVGLRLGGAGDKPEGDFSRSARKSLFKVPKSKAGDISKEAIVSHNADGSLIAAQVNPSLLNKQEQGPDQLKGGPIQMKPDPKTPEPITPIPQGQVNDFYGDRENDNNTLLENFKTSTGAQLAGFEGLAGNIETKLGAAKKKAEGDIRKQTTLTKGRITREFGNSKKRALSEANKAKRILSGWNTTLEAKIRKATKTAKNSLKGEFDTAMTYLSGLEGNIGKLINDEISAGAKQIRAVGTTKAGEAVKIASERAGAYAAMEIPTMGRVAKFTNGETYEKDRHDARVKAANDVGKGYSEQFIAKANEAAQALEGNKGTILEGAKAKITEAITKVKAKKTAGDKEIEASEKATLDGAQQTLKQYNGLVDSQLEGAYSQLEGTKTAQLNAATEQGKQQVTILNEIHSSAVKGLQKSHSESTANIRNSIQTVIDEVTGMENPEPGKVEVILNSSSKSISKTVTDLTKSFNQGITDSAKGYDTHSGKAKEALSGIEKGAKEAFAQVVTDLRDSVGDTLKQAKTANDALYKGHKDEADKSAKKYGGEIKGLQKDTETGFEAVKKNIAAEVTKSVTGLTSEFGAKLSGIHGEISTKAKEAYDAVKPRWKGWVTFLIKVIIAIAVTVAIGLLAASGVGLLAGLGLAFLIGAAGAVLETGLIDLLVEGKFSGFGTYFKNAVLGGIGGMFTFVGARWGGGAGKFLEGKLGSLGTKFFSEGAGKVLGKIGSYIGEVGVGFALDMAGSFAKEVSGQLYDNIGSVLKGEGWKGIDWGKAAGNTFSLENIAINFLGNLGGKALGDFLTAKGIGGSLGKVPEWINSKLPRWAMSAEHLAKIDMPGGGLDLPGSTHVDAPDAKVDVNNGHVDVPEGKIDAPEGKVDAPEGKVDAPEGKVDAPEGKVDAPEGKVDAPEGKVDAPEGKVDAPEGKVDAPEGKVDAPEGKVDAPEGKVDAPEGKVDAPEGKVEGPEGKVDGPEGKVEGPETKKTGTELAKGEPFNYPDAPKGYVWVNQGGRGVPILRRIGVKGGSDLIQVQYNPTTGKFVDPNTGQIFNNAAELELANTFHTTPGGPVTIPKTPEFDAFKASADFKGDDALAARAYELFQQGKWTELETFVHQNGLNSNWPPNQGFTSITPQTIPTGMKIDRYGHPGGKFVSPEGVPYTQRALPVGTDGKPYNVYEVLKPINVEAGPAIPWFGEAGMGVQFKLPMSVADLISGGYLKLVTIP